MPWAFLVALCHLEFVVLRHRRSVSLVVLESIKTCERPSSSTCENKFSAITFAVNISVDPSRNSTSYSRVSRTQLASAVGLARRNNIRRKRSSGGDFDSRQQWGLRGGTTFDGRGHVGGDFDSRQQWGLRGFITGDGGGRVGLEPRLAEAVGLARRWSLGLVS
jgi:hypothetical protein